LKIEAYRHRPGTKNSEGSWVFEVGRSIALDDENGDEIGALMSFLHAISNDTFYSSMTGRTIPIMPGAR
jgi:hypothetical protein